MTAAVGSLGRGVGWGAGGAVVVIVGAALADAAAGWAGSALAVAGWAAMLDLAGAIFWAKDPGAGRPIWLRSPQSQPPSGLGMQRCTTSPWAAELIANARTERVSGIECCIEAWACAVE